MKKLAWLTALFLFSMITGYASGQTTAITATVTDSDGFIWTTAKVTVAFVPNASFPNLNQYTLNGHNLATYQPYNSLLNQSVISNPTSGVFALTLLDNTQIQPQGSSWFFAIQSNTSAQASTYNPVQVSGTSQNLTSFLSTFSTVPRFSAVNVAGTFGYGDVEITTVPNPGGLYYNTTTLSTRQWNGTVWTNLAGGGSSGVNQILAGSNITLSPTNGLGTVTINSSGGGGGGGSFILNVGEMGALASGLNAPLTHTNHYVMPTLQSTSQINTFLATIGQAALVFQNGDSVYNSFGNRWWQAHITHEGVMFFTYKLNTDDYGILADGRLIQMSFTTSSKTFTISSDVMRSYDIGKSVWLWNNSTQTSFQSQIQTILDGSHFTVASFPPWTGSGNFWVATDNTTNFQQMLTDLRVGGGQGPTGPGSGTYITPAGITLSAGATMSHTLDPQGTSIEGAGVISELVFPAGEDAFATPDAFTAGGEQQGSTHLNDFAVFINGGIDATKAWTKVNDSGTTAITALYRPGYFRTKDSNNPFAPEWCIGSGANGGGCSLGVATTNGTTVMCVTAGTVPSSGQVLFPYAAGGLIQTTYVSGAGSCGSGTPITLGASIPAGTNQEFWIGTNFQHTAADFPASRTYPFTLAATNPLIPTPASEDGLAPYGLIQIGNEQCTYYNINFNSGVNTYTVTGCTGSAVDHPSNSYIAPLNPFKPSMPWPVPTTAGGNQTTPANASYYPGHNIGNCAWAFPQSDGSNNQAASWSNAHIENIFISQGEFPEFNNTCAFYFVGYPYATHFNDIRISGPQYGPIQSVPAKNNHAWNTGQPTADGMTWTGITIRAGYLFDFINANQTNFSNFDTYSQLGSLSGSVGCGGGFFFTSGWDDETGAPTSFVTQSETHNLYVEPETGSHCQQEALNEFDGISVLYNDIHQGGGGFVYMGGTDQHFLGGNFNNQGLGGTGGVAPITNYGNGNTILYTENIGTTQRCNNFDAPNFSCGFINWGRDFYGLVREGGVGPLMNPAFGNTRSAIDGQNGDTFSIGNVGTDFIPNAAGILITPSEFTDGTIESSPFQILWEYDSTATVTQSNVGCNVGNNTAAKYCSPFRFDGGGGVWIGKGGRISAGKNMVYWSSKSGLSTNTTGWGISVGCSPGVITYVAGPFTEAVTNAYPATSVGVAQHVVDLSPYAGCGLVLDQYGANSADTIYTQFVAVAPIPDNLNVQQLSIQGTGQPLLNFGTNGAETWQLIAPTTGCGSTYPNGSIWHNLAGTAAGVNRFYICDAATTTWNAKF